MLFLIWRKPIVAVSFHSWFHVDDILWINFKLTAQPVDNSQERTLLLLKPDALQRKLVGKVIERFENVNFKLVGMKMILVNKILITLQDRWNETHFHEYNRMF